MSEPERQALSRLASFPGSFSLEAAEAVADVELDTVEELVAKSLISVIGRLQRATCATGCWTRSAPTAASSSLTAEQVRGRHLAFYVGLAEGVQNNNALGGSDADVRMLVDELPNLRMALDRAERAILPPGCG